MGAGLRFVMPCNSSALRCGELRESGDVIIPGGMIWAVPALVLVRGSKVRAPFACSARCDRNDCDAGLALADHAPDTPANGFTWLFGDSRYSNLTKAGAVQR